MGNEIKNYSKNDYLILGKLLSDGYDTEFKSCNLDKLQDLSVSEKNPKGLSKNKLRSTVRAFIEEGYMNEGLREYKKKTYYITEVGKERVKELFGINSEEGN